MIEHPRQPEEVTILIRADRLRTLLRLAHKRLQTHGGCLPQDEVLETVAEIERLKELLGMPKAELPMPLRMMLAKPGAMNAAEGESRRKAHALRIKAGKEAAKRAREEAKVG